MNNDNFGLHLEDLKRFLGLQLSRKVLVEKNTPIKQLWRKKSGHFVFENTNVPKGFKAFEIR